MFGVPARLPGPIRGPRIANRVAIAHGARMTVTLAHWLRSGAVAFLLFAVAGCASSRIDWNTRIGAYTYDDAVREYGPPDKSAKLTDGTLVADWTTARGGFQTATAYGGGFHPRSRYGWGSPTYVVVDPPTPDRILRLTFDPEGKLASWQRVYQ